MLIVLILVLIVIAALAVVGWRAYRPAGTDTERGAQVRELETPPADRDTTWDPTERYPADR